MTTDELKKQGRGGGIVTFDFQSFAGAVSYTHLTLPTK